MAQQNINNTNDVENLVLCISQLDNFPYLLHDIEHQSKKYNGKHFC